MNIRVAGIICESNRILTMKYIYGEENVYVIPGGNLEFGEEMKEALARELEEELKLKVDVLSEILTVETIRENEKTLHQLFEVEKMETEAELDPDETKALELCWLEIDKLSNFNLYPNVGTQIQQWSKNELTDKYVGEIVQNWF